MRLSTPKVTPKPLATKLAPRTIPRIQQTGQHLRPRESPDQGHFTLCTQKGEVTCHLPPLPITEASPPPLMPPTDLQGNSCGGPWPWTQDLQRGRAQAQPGDLTTSRPAHGWVPGSQGGVCTSHSHPQRKRKQSIRATRSSHKKQTEAPELTQTIVPHAPCTRLPDIHPAHTRDAEALRRFWRFNFPLSKRKLNTA